ncbi:uncharacterized protein THITE_2118193 [Thermothielavioides terrestris NRRL 8126]|uniref:Plasma membrane fusion protein PRM1 n=1 Tax=Thermothielavioides terrestris (strain ATCC 38088 / NRRL 8126) TaxID=578455 RepID=G2R920_THETT|nr:uncharacterized protein THITE_2118193 [Thermothielavioides terrestris NRRL 8126]AEO68615.1 hypothetical protein THITE_2118193 [Thermothielavioides terrestris NRRL 8126]
MAVTTVLTDLAHSLGELLSSVFGTAYALVHSFVADLFGLLAGFFALANDLVRGVVDLVGGVGRFVTGETAPPSPPRPLFSFRKSLHSVVFLFFFFLLPSLIM